MTKINKKIKLVGINLLLICLGSIVISELFFKALRPKFPMEVFGKSYAERLQKAKKDSIKRESLTLVIGDSFAHHQIGTNGNFFDSIFNCQEEIKCNYHNLAQSGVGLPFYWNSILSVLSNRVKGSQTKVVIGIYFGNDIPFIDPSKPFKTCSDIHILSPKMVEKYNDTWIQAIKRRLPSMLFLARSIKSLTRIDSTNNVQNINTNAKKLRFYRSDPSQGLLSINQLADKIDPEIMDKASRNIINPWEVSLALANPYYFDDLYRLSRKWSRNSVKCLAENVVSNINAIKNNHPQTDFIIIGIPDKFYWSKDSYESTTQEYQELGYRFGSKKGLNDIETNSLSIYFNNAMKSNKIEYIYLPNLLNSGTNIVDWFYYQDMHINNKGNKNISELLQKKLNNIEKQISF